MKTTHPYQAGARILEVARDHPDRTALIIDDETWSYAELVAAAQSIAEQFPKSSAAEAQAITAVLAQRHISSYAGILAARLAGHAYVPLNVNHPCQRNATIFRNSGATRVVCGARAAEKWHNIFTTAYLGEIDFEQRSVEHWFSGARALQSVTDQMVCFVHPADRIIIEKIKDECGTDKLDEFIRRISEELGVKTLPWDQFDLEPADFLDINHMNARGGREKLSRQLAEMLIS
jgi:acyl-CoA synthetase (AMP-forming)/AMP-acid ligase II